MRDRQYFLASSAATSAYRTILLWMQIIFAFALIVGVIGVARIHLLKLLKRRSGWANSAVLLGAAAVMAVLGFSGGIDRGSAFLWVFDHWQAPMQSTVFSLLAFYVASAAYRGFRARSGESLILVIAAMIVLIGRVPLGDWISPYIPATADWFSVSSGPIWEDGRTMHVSRRWVFGAMGVVVAAALLFRANLPIKSTSETERVFEIIESLDTSAVVMISFDHEASSLPEVGPLGEAIADHCFRRGVKVVGLALFSEGTAAGYSLLNRRARAFGRTYGTDWIYLGFRPQYTAAILGMGESIRQVFDMDYEGHPLDSSPLGRQVGNYDDIALVVSVADGSMPTYWVEFAGTRYGEKIVAALTAVMVTSFLPYLEAGQLEGMLTGLKAAAEYEKLLGTPGAGTRGMDAQSAAHALIAILIIVGNVQAWRTRRRRRGESQ
jgi:hypothetical protein